MLRFVVQESASLNQHPFNVSHKPVEVFVAKLMGDNLRQSGPSMAAIDGPAGPSMATKSAIDGPAGPVVAGDHLRRDSPLVMDDGTDQFPFLGSLLKCHAEQLHHSAL